MSLLPGILRSGGKVFPKVRGTPDSRIYSIGDSISYDTALSGAIATALGRDVFPSAIGGSTSPTMVGRARGVELIASSPTPGTVTLNWKRHIAYLTDDTGQRASWTRFANKVTTPTAIEVYEDNRLKCIATRVLKAFTTNIASNNKIITCAGHGLSDGEQVAFFSDDANSNVVLTTASHFSLWQHNSTTLPNVAATLNEHRVYFVANATADTFELKENPGDVSTLTFTRDNSSAGNRIECGWSATFTYTGGTLTWQPVGPFDNRIWVMEVSANDFPYSSALEITIPNTIALLDQFGASERFVIVAPPVNCGASRGPGSDPWNRYFVDYLPWLLAKYPDNSLDTMTVLGTYRTAQEIAYLDDPATPELKWISGDPAVPAGWDVRDDTFGGAVQKWIGPGFTPLHLRASFSDEIHLNATGYTLLGQAVATFITSRNW